jgi:hypothetical protein
MKADVHVQEETTGRSKMLKVAVMLLAVTFLSSCVITPVWESQTGGQVVNRGRAEGSAARADQDGRIERTDLANRSGGLSQTQRDLIAAADELLASQNFLVEGYRYPYDCTGTVLAIYAMAGINLVDYFPQYTGGGVTRLYGIATDRNLFYDADLPAPGDLIFWDNTYDKNGDKLWNDELTHVGMVLSVSPDGIVEYIHHNYSKGEVKAKMSLLEPDVYQAADGTLVNSPMRMRSHRHLNPDEWLSSHLYRGLGALHKL